MANAIDGLGRSVALVAAIVGVTATVITSINAQTKQQLDSYGAFRAAVASDENYWKARYDEYLKVGDYADKDPRRRNAIVSLYTFANRDIPAFDEFKVSVDAKKAAIKELTQMKTGFLNTLDDEAGRDDVLNGILERRGFRESPDPAIVAAAAATAPPLSSLPPADPTPQVLAAASASGWDVDIFWCRGNGEPERYDRAVRVGRNLASFALAGRSIAPGVFLGRIRVKPVTPELQQKRIPDHDLAVRPDAGAGELDAANALAKALNRASPDANFNVAQSGGALTSWYLSVFVCAAPTADGAQREPLPPERLSYATPVGPPPPR